MVDYPGGKTLHFVTGTQQEQRHDDQSADDISQQHIAGEFVARVAEPPALQEQHDGGIGKDGAFVKHIFQSHRTDTTARHQTAAVQIVALHGNRADRERRYISKNTEENHFRCLPKRKHRESAAN